MGIADWPEQDADRPMLDESAKVETPLVDVLRDWWDMGTAGVEATQEIMRKAADRIEQLERERDEARISLSAIRIAEEQERFDFRAIRERAEKAEADAETARAAHHITAKDWADNEAELAAAKRDAERWQKQRQLGLPWRDDKGFWTVRVGQAADFAIDAAMTEGQPK
jgi:hypothetical protein